MMKNTQCGSS